MILKITNKCEMNCSHCMEDSRPEGKHMSDRVFLDSIDFMKKLNFMMLVISGGEPTMHPDLVKYIKIIKKRMPTPIVITTNGMLLKDKDYVKSIIDLGVFISVTNDSRYYPTKVSDLNINKGFWYSDKISGGIFPLGRAKDKIFENSTKRYSPLCFNIRSIFNFTKDLVKALSILELKHEKYCSFSIDINGGIHMSECTNCTSIGTIYDSIDTLDKNILNFKCNKCGLFDNLGKDKKRHLGE